MIQSDPQSASLVEKLRTHTSAHHAGLDAALHFRPGEVTRERYVGLLRGTLNVLVALEPALTQWLGVGTWPRRLACLRADLAALAAPAALQPVPTTAPASLAAAYGCVYVVEGSTLGGMALAPIIERELGLAAGVATSYLRLWGTETAAHWRAWLGRLSEFGKSVGPAEHQEACAMAAATFVSYAQALQLQGAIAT